MRTASPLPIRTHLLRLVLGVTIPLLVLSGLLAWRYAVAEQLRIEESASNSAREVAAGIDIMIAEVTATAQVLAGTEALLDGNLAAFHPIAVAAAAASGGPVGVRDAASRQLVNSLVPWGSRLPDRTSLASQDAEAAVTGRAAVSNGFTGIADGAYQFAVVLPLPPVAAPARFLSLSVPVHRVQRVLEKVVTLPAGMRAGVVDRQGRFIARTPDPAAWIGQPARILGTSAATSGSVPGPGIDNAPARVFVALSAASGWRVGIAVPDAVLWAPLRRALLTLGGLAAAAIVLSLAAATLGARRIGRAIQALSEAGAALQRGQAVSMPATSLLEANQVGTALRAAAEERRVREAALQEQGERLRLFIERAPVAIAMFDADMHPLARSRRYAEEYGPEAVVPARWADVHRRVLAGEIMRADDDPVLRADGHTDWLRWEMAPWARADGSVGGSVLFAETITARKQAEAALRDSETRLRAVLDTVPVSVIVAEAPGGRLLFGNRGTERVFRHKLIPSESVDDYFEWESYHADGRRVEGREYPLAQTLASAAPATGEYEFVCGDGVRRWIAVASAAITADGEVKGAVVVAQDVDDERRAAAALRDSEERFRTLAATMPALIFVTDAHGANTYTNTVFQHFTGLSAEALLGDGWLATLHPDDTERAAATWSRAWSTGAGYAAEYRFRRHDDVYRWHLVRGTPVREAEGGIVQWVGVCTDVQDVVDARNALSAANAGLETRVVERTAELASALARMQEEMRERAAAEEQVRQLQKMEAVGQLTGGIAHDFNNMLAIVLGSLDLAKRRLNDPARALRGIENAEEGARRAATLTARLLAFSRQSPLAPNVLDPNKLVAGMSELLRRTLGENIRVETVLAGGLWRSYADATQLENALLNLCVNSRDAMPEGGRLTIETGNAYLDDEYALGHADVLPGQYVLVAVSDTGTGMPADVVAHAFDPFYTTKGVGKGTGLGLSQVYGFVKQSGGHVKIYSEPGQGTVVKIYLPRHHGTEEEAASPAPPTADWPRAAASEVVLVVEDEPGVRHISVDALRELGYTVVQAADANQALEVLATQPRIDLLFTDVVMPEMNGRRLAELALAQNPALHVLFTTGYTRNAVVHNGTLDAGVAFLAKPFTLEQLARKVRAVLDGGGHNRPG